MVRVGQGASLLVLEKHHFNAFVQFLATGELVLQPELTRSAVIKNMFSKAQTVCAVRSSCCFYSILQSHCQLITLHSITDLLH